MINMKSTYLLLFFTLNTIIALGQAKAKKEVDYAGTKIVLARNLKSNAENEIQSNVFYAKWYISKRETLTGIIDSFEKEVKGNELGKVIFLSKNSEFTGIKYSCKTCPKFKFKILAFGKINNELIVLNLWFINNPKTNTDLDKLAHNFITFK